MQDLQTGALVPLKDETQESKDVALPRERQGPTFYIGERLEIKGGNFEVQSIGRKAMVLRSLPGTDIKQ